MHQTKVHDVAASDQWTLSSADPSPTCSACSVFRASSVSRSCPGWPEQMSPICSGLCLDGNFFQGA